MPSPIDDDLLMGLVERALALPGDQRQAYLEHSCATNNELLALATEYVRRESRLGNFMAKPLFQPLEQPIFKSGDVLKERFHILGRLGEGGMSVVYEALDEILGAHIAIKCAKSGFGRRLPAEALLDQKVSHPNVCRVYDIHHAVTDQGNVDFLTMELLVGETLTERLKRGPIAEPEARDIARQICAGLAEAHRHQIVHGDIKSNNVILTQGPNGSIRAVLTDLGLARDLQAAGAPTDGSPGGTLHYMAPELWQGENISFASDVYALGVVLFELVARPKARAWLNLPWKERSAPPPVNPGWDRLFARCLAANPARRFRDASEVAAALAPPQTKRNILMAVAAAGLMAIAAWMGYQRAVAPAREIRLAVLPVESDPGLEGAASQLYANLNQREASIRGTANTSFTLMGVLASSSRSEETPVALAKRLGATHVLLTRLSGDPKRIHLTVLLNDVAGGASSHDWSVDYSSTEFRHAPVAIAGFTTSVLHLPAATAAVSPGAANDYNDALKLLRYRSQNEQTLNLLDRASKMDPESPLIYAALAEAQWVRWATTYDPAWRARAEESLHQASLRDPDLAPVHRIAGLLLARSARYDQAIAEYQRAVELDPQSADAYRRLGSALFVTGQVSLAAANFQKAVDVDPGDYRTWWESGSFHQRSGGFSQAAVQLRHAVDLAPAFEPGPRYDLATVYKDLGEFDKAIEEATAGLRAETSARGLVSLYQVFLYQGRELQAIPYIRQAINLNPNWALLWMDLGDAYRRLNQPAQARDAYRRAMDLEEGDLSRDPRNSQNRAFAGYLAARLNDRSRAETEVGQALQLTPVEADSRYLAALTYETIDLRDKALGALRAATRESLLDIGRRPDMAEFSRDSRFQSLIAAAVIH